MNRFMKMPMLDNMPSRHLITANLALLLLVLSGCDNQTVNTSPEPPVVDVTTVMQKDVPIHREWIGTMDGYINATIRPQVTGYLIKQNYREGDAVKKGQILFEIDPRTFQATVDQAEAARNRQQAIYATAKATLARVKPLVEKNALSKKDLDDAIGSEASARAALDQANAALDTARLNLGFTRIASPINGIAGIAKAQIGDLLSPNSPTELTTVSTVDPIKVFISISEREYLDFTRNGTASKNATLPLQLILVDGSIHPYPGKLSLLDRQVDPTTGTVKVGALFPNPGNRLRPGQFAKIRASVETLKDALLVPQRAVTDVQGKYLVAVVDRENKVDLRLVRPGAKIGSDWIISEGLNPGENVIVAGTQKIRPGAIVRPNLLPLKQDAVNPAPAAEPEKPATKQPAEPSIKG